MSCVSLYILQFIYPYYYWTTQRTCLTWKLQKRHITFANYVKIISIILLYRLTQYIEEIIGDHQCGFQRNRSTTDHIFCICEKPNKSGNTMKPGISSSLTLWKPMILLGGRSCIIFLIELGISMKLIKLIKTRLNETYSRVRVGKHWSEMFLIKNDLRQGDALSLLLFNFAVERAIRRV